MKSYITMVSTARRVPLMLETVRALNQRGGNELQQFHLYWFGSNESDQTPGFTWPHPRSLGNIAPTAMPSGSGGQWAVAANVKARIGW